ncbi:MAG: patatin-like phospholipase family protein [Bacteroidota bacterium]
MSYQLKTRFELKQPKKILALDGGGIRGALSLGYLTEIERILRERYQNPDYRLCEYFDLIGGTSTGSIIAGCLAVGMSVAEIKERYFKLGATIFGKSNFLGALTGAKFSPKALEEGLQSTFGEIRLGDEVVKTGLCVFAKRVDTQSLWTLNNNPNFPYYEYNKNIKLWAAIRASAAAPTFFRPVPIKAGSEDDAAIVEGIFTDGGISPANNPALWLLMMARISAYGYQWAAGSKNIMIVSVGTGKAVTKFNLEDVEDWNTLNWATAIPNMMLSDSTQYNEIIMQMISTSPTPQRFDRIMEDLSEEFLGTEPLCSYLRYNTFLDKETLAALDPKYGTMSEKKVEDIVDFTKGENAEELYHIGYLAAKNEVRAAHLSTDFDTVEALKF